MRPSALLPLVSASIALAKPASELQAVLGEISAYTDDVYGGLLGTIAKGVDHVVQDVEKTVLKETENVKTWIDAFGTPRVTQDGLTYELVRHPAFKEHSLRVTEPTLCDSSVQQYSGYLDITDGKHLFFWFFESRGSPKDDPLVLWLNGGPGCSSSTGLLFELGPCAIADEGQNTTSNPHSWTNNANVIFLDQPVNVGYSYSSDGSTVNTSPVAGQDVYAFLELFLARYPQYADKPFHIAAESYGGTYVPNIASIIHKRNNELALAPNSDLLKINLASLLLGNGLSDPYHQFASVPDYACNGPYAPYDPDGAECTALRSKVPTCQRLVKSCYDYNSRLSCVPAALYCWSQMLGPLQNLGLNLYDLRRKCDRSKDGQLCYRELNWIETWMNDPKHKAELGVNPDRTFESCNMEVNQNFMYQGDGMHNAAALLPDLINDGIRLLVYAGNADAMCNYMGNEAWMNALEHQFHAEFAASGDEQWVAAETGRVAGRVRSAGGGGLGAGNVTYVEVFEAGHMVPFDQPEAALDLFERWLNDVSLASN